MAAGRKRRRAKKQDTETHAQRSTRGRAEYVRQCIRDQPWLDGNTRTLIRLQIERYGGGESAARSAIKLCYDWLDEEREKNVTRLVGFLDRTHRYTIEMGQRQQDGRVITPAAAELRKLHGIGEPDRVNVSGGLQTGLSADAAELLGALRLTNAQRLAEIDKLEAEVAAEEAALAQTGSDAAMVAVINTHGEINTEDEDDEDSDDGDDE